MSGVAAIAEALKGNATLQSVKCALPFNPLLDQLADRALAPPDAKSPPDAKLPFVFRVDQNQLGSEGAQHIADMLKVNTTLKSVR